MNLSPRQWIVLIVLIAGFAIAALVVRRDDAPANLPEIDTALWCSGAEALVGAGDLFSGEAADAAASDFDQAQGAIFEVENTAPWEIRLGLARIADLAHITREQLDTVAWPDALDAARAQVDEPVVDQALVDLDAEMKLCGLQLNS